MALDVNSLTHSVSVFRVSMTFSGYNIFHNNFGGGPKLTESRLNLEGVLDVVHNFADQGGGISMFGRCLVSL